MFRFLRRRVQWWFRQLTDRQINAFARVGVAAVLVAAAALAGANWLNRDASEPELAQAAGVEQLLPGSGLPAVPTPETVASSSTSSTGAAPTTQSPPTTVEVLAAVPDTTEGIEDSDTTTTPPATQPPTTTPPATQPPTTTTTPPTTIPPTTTLPTTTTAPANTVPPTTTLPPTTTTSVPDDPLVVGSMTPNEMEAGTTISAEITGSGFLPGLSVTFSGGSGPQPQAFNYGVTPNRIMFSVSVSGGGPDRDRGWVVTVNNPNGDSASLGTPFIVKPQDDD